MAAQISSRPTAAGPLTPPAVPDGAIMVKEMFPAPAAACRDVDPLKLFPTSGAAVMVRDAGARMTAGSGAGSAWRERLGAGLAARPPTTACRTWASASTASTATPRRPTI